MKSLKFCGNYQNVKQRHKVRKVCWENSLICQCIVTTNLQFVKTKNVISVKYNEIKYAWNSKYGIVLFFPPILYSIVVVHFTYTCHTY